MNFGAETDLGGGGAFFLTVGYHCLLRPLLALCDIMLIGASHKNELHA